MRSIVEFIRSRSIRFWIISVVLLGIAVAVVVFGSMFTIYKISIDDSDSYTITAVIDTPDDPAQVVQGFGLYLIPRSAKYLDVRGGDRQTRVAIVEKPFLLISNLSIPLKPQKQTRKIGKDSISCSGFSQDIAFTYSCRDLSLTMQRFVTMKSLGDTNEVIQNSTTLPKSPLAQSRYKDGILLIHQRSSFGSSLATTYITAKGELASSPLSTATAKQNDLVSVIPDSTGSDDFVFFNQSDRKVFFFDSLAGKPIVTKIETPYTSSVDSMTCDLHIKQFSCFFGPSTESSNDLSHNEVDPMTDGVIETIEFTSPKPHSSSYSTDLKVDKLCLTNTATSVALSGSELFAIGNSDVYMLANAVNRLDCGNTNAYISSDSSVFVVDQNVKQSNLVFRTKHLTLSSIEAYGDTILFSGFPQNTSSSSPSTFVYKLGNKDFNGIRPEEYLPFSDTSLFIDMDYDQSTIYIKPVLDITSNSQTGETTYNKDSFRETSRQIENLIRSKPTLQSYKIKYLLP